MTSQPHVLGVTQAQVGHARQAVACKVQSLEATPSLLKEVARNASLISFTAFLRTDSLASHVALGREARTSQALHGLLAHLSPGLLHEKERLGGMPYEICVSQSHECFLTLLCHCRSFSEMLIEWQTLLLLSCRVVFRRCVETMDHHI